MVVINRFYCICYRTMSLVILFSQYLRNVDFPCGQYVKGKGCKKIKAPIFKLFPVSCDGSISWWRHQMETFSVLLAICAGNSPVTGEFPAQRPVTRSFDIFFGLRLNGRLSKQSWDWWFETPSRPLWRHNNVWVTSNKRRHLSITTFQKPAWIFLFNWLFGLGIKKTSKRCITCALWWLLLIISESSYIFNSIFQCIVSNFSTNFPTHALTNAYLIEK